MVLDQLTLANGGKALWRGLRVPFVAFCTVMNISGARTYSAIHSLVDRLKETEEKVVESKVGTGLSDCRYAVYAYLLAYVGARVCLMKQLGVQLQLLVHGLFRRFLTSNPARQNFIDRVGEICVAVWPRFEQARVRTVKPTTFQNMLTGYGLCYDAQGYLVNIPSSVRFDLSEPLGVVDTEDPVLLSLYCITDVIVKGNSIVQKPYASPGYETKLDYIRAFVKLYVYSLNP